MAPSTSQEDSEGVTSREIRNEQPSLSAHSPDNNVRNTTHPPATVRKKRGLSPSRSSHKDLDRNSNNIDYGTTTVNSLLSRFLLSLNAKETVNIPGYRTFILQPGAYARALESLFRSDHDVWEYAQKLRHDFVDDKYLILKMLSGIHEVVKESVGYSIREQLSVIKKASNEPTRRLVQNIVAAGSKDIKFNDRKGHRQPDQQFIMTDSYYPGVVIEVAHSQSFEMLRDKAEDLIIDSCGKIQLVIGLETDNKKECKISAWRPDLTRSKKKGAVAIKATIEQDTIRDKHGKLKPGSMTFQLQDFGTNLASTYPDAELTKVIVLDYSDLADYLAAAEKLQNVQPPPLPKQKKRRRSDSLGGNLAPQDERKVRRLERM